MSKHKGGRTSAIKSRAAGANGRLAHRESSAHFADDLPVFEKPVPLSDLPSVPPFPLALFPAPIADYWRAAAGALNVPVDYIAGPGLAVLSGAIGRTWAAEVKPGYSESPLFWVVTVARPGDSKSPSLRTVQSPLIKAETEWREEYRVAMEEYETKLADHKREHREWEVGGCQGMPPPKPVKPVLRQVLLDDTTTEAAARVLRDNPRGVVLLKDELIGLVRALDQYKGGRGNDKSFWLSAWNGKGQAKVNRARDHDAGPLVVVDPFAAIGGMLCPDVIPELREELSRSEPVADGWADRFLFCYPDPLPAVRETWTTIPQATAHAYAELVGRLIAADMVRGDPDPRSHVAPFGDAAREAWEQFTAEIAERMNDRTDGDGYRGVLSKLRHYAVRFAALFHCLDRAAYGVDAGDEVTGHSVIRAAGLVWYFDAHCRRVLGVGDRETEPAKALLVALSKWENGFFTKRALFDKVRGQVRFRKASNLDGPLRLLEAHGYIRGIHPDQRPGRPSERFIINPAWPRSSQ